MASSDEEGEIIPECVTNYHFVDHIGRTISFSILPLQWSEDEVTESLSTQIFLHGSADNGLWQIYKKVTAWKFELSYVLPEIYVLTKDKTWIKLQKPRKCFEQTIKTILVTVHCLHFVKKNPETSRTILWNHLLKAFSSYEVEPSENDLLHHMPLINEAASRDKNIAKSEYLAAFCLTMPGKRKALHEDNQIAKESKFIVNGVDDGDGDESDEDQLFDSVCAICDNGGEILVCEGRCIRSFHATVEAGAESLCGSLGFTDVQVEAIQNFLCRNCQYRQHQCFICGILGSSDKSSATEVFPCVSATCGHFYHPDCVAKVLHPSDVTQAEKIRKKIAAGESFACPAHKCFICKQGEDKRVYDLQFAMCRRCPKAYHRKCLPKKISYEGDCDKNVLQRAWDGLLPNRILIYCLEHEIIPELGTPERNHILFPSVDGKRKRLVVKLKSAKEVLTEKRMTKALLENGRFHGNVTEKTSTNIHKKGKCTVGEGSKNFGERLLGQGSDSEVTDAKVESLRMNDRTVQERAHVPSAAEKSKASLGYDRALLSMKSHAIKPMQQLVPSGKTKKIIATMPVMKKAGGKQPLIDEDMEKRIVMLMKQATSSFDSEEFIKKQNVLSSIYSRSVVDKTLTMGKVEVAVKAVRAALKKLEEGCTIDDAKAVCEPEVLKQIARWKKNLGVYLAPFLHGMRYTSFGRHFTKVDKLKEIVDRLCWYVQDGDMVVDFCCGSNDFSCLLKEKVEEMGKSCSFKNYDLIQAKNNFNFEKRDWMKVGVEELPSGSQLIMGLNPPFGVHGTRANQFIEKALEFKPKLLILIVPRETKRLDQKKHPYDLIWEDDSMLSGKSFYLPGSVNVHDQQIDQWNLEPPPLYLWSRPDWTARHKAIARSHGHLPTEQEEACVEPKNAGKVISNYLMEENLECFGDFSYIMSGYRDLSGILDDVPEDSDEMCVNKELFTPTNSATKNTKSSILFENRPQGDFSTCAEVNAARPGLSGQHSRYGTEHATFHSSVSNDTGSVLGQMNGGALPAGQPNWSSCNNLGPNR